MTLPTMTQSILIEVLPHYAGPSRETPLVQAHPGDAGMDLYAAEDAVIPPGGRALIPTGLKFALPFLPPPSESETALQFATERGLQLEVRPKSGLALKLGLTLLNTPGTVDSGYRGEVAVIVYNSNPVANLSVFETLVSVLKNTTSVETLEQSIQKAHGDATLVIKRGQKIAQAVFTQYVVPKVEVLPEGVSVPESSRGAGGFGSTGDGLTAM
jgi:dUTP pyrophosphatase